MPRSTTLSRQYSSRCGNSACMLGTLTCTSQSIVDQDTASSGISRIIGTSGAGASRRLQRTRQGTLGFRLDLFLMAAHEDGGDDQDDDGGNDEDDHAPAGQPLDLPAQRIGGNAEEYRPGERAEDIGQQELRLRHA